MKINIFGAVFFIFFIYSGLFAQQLNNFTWRVESWGNVTITGYTGTDNVVTIPAELDGRRVTAIGDRVFHRKNLTNVILPNSLIWIHTDAFSNNRLTTILIPDSVNFILFGAFYNNQLIDVTLPKALQEIEQGAFQNNQLTSIVIPDNVMRIGVDAFDGNPLISITIGEGVRIRFDSFGESGFEQFYESTGRLAGTYTRPNINSTTWTKR